MRNVSFVVGVVLGAVAFSIPEAARADEKNVTDSAGLLAAIASAKPGDVITLQAGTYKLAGANCTANGAAANPITVTSATPLGATVELDGAEGFHVTGAHWHFEGLDVRGVCASDDACEHAFHVTGGEAEGFVLRRSRVRDFNAQLKVNAAPDGSGQYQMANGGLVEFSEFSDTHARATGNPVTKLNIDGGAGWIVRGNYLHDFHKAGGNEISYGAFMKSGGSGGVFERNLVVCEKDDNTGGIRIGLSFGGGGTGAQFCAPAFDPNVPCSVEHTGGVLRNNVITTCSDVGIYLNRAASTTVLHNTLIQTNGIDFRFDTTSGESHANLLMGTVRMRDGGTFTTSDDLAEQPLDFFTALYTDALGLDFTLKGDATALQTAPPRADLTDDYCARTRPSANLAKGALEHSLGDCDVTPPPEGTGTAGSTGTGGATSSSAATTGSGGAASVGVGSSTTGGVDAKTATEPGCGCVAVGGAPANGGRAAAIGLLGFALVRGRRRRAP